MCAKMKVTTREKQEVDGHCEKSNPVTRPLRIWLMCLLMAVAAFAAEATETASGNENQSDKNLMTSVDGVQSVIAFQQEMSIREALRTLSDQFEINIVPSRNVDGIIGFSKLRNVTFEEAMNAILGPEFVYEQEGPVIRVYTQEEYQKMMTDKQRMVHKVFTLYYITSEETH